MAKNAFRYFKTSPEIIQLSVMMYVRFPLSLRNVEDLLHERGIDVCHESVRLWVDRFGTYFASKIRKRRSEAMRQVPQWRWHLDEVFVKIRGETHYLWRAVDHEGGHRRYRVLICICSQNPETARPRSIVDMPEIVRRNLLHILLHNSQHPLFYYCYYTVH